MDLDTTANRKILLLMADPASFFSTRRYLEDQGFEVSESPDEEGFDAFVVDLFFMRGGMGQYIEQNVSPGPVLLVAHTNEKINSDSFLEADEIIVLPPLNRYDVPRVAEAFNQCNYFRFLRETKREFGGGLWAFLMQHWQSLNSPRYSKVLL